MKKKSEYESERWTYWLGQALRPEAADHWVRYRVARDVAAVEAAGTPWEPEEEPLPERLVTTKSPGGCWVVMVPLPLSVTGPDYRWPTSTEADEAVRRYNAWPTIRAWAERHGSLVLAAILAGQSGQP